MKNVNNELLDFFSQDYEFQYLNFEIQEFLHENQDWKQKKKKAERLLKAVAEKVGKSYIYESLIKENLMIYEEAVTRVLPEHRDHFVHSAYVYLLGLYIFKKDANYSNCLEEAFRYNHPAINGNVHNWERVFHFRWAITALFHDAGYPIEIAAKQMNKYLKDVKWNKNHDDDKEPMVFDFRQFWATYSFDYLRPYDPLVEGGKDVVRQAAQYIMTDNVFDMIAYNLACKYLDFSYKTISNLIKDRFKERMRSGILDHGIIGALLLANWVHDLYSKKREDLDSEYFYCHFGDCLGAIVLHTIGNWLPDSFRKKILMKKHPIAWLLILCDELQEWSRPSGKEIESDINIMPFVDKFHIGIFNNQIQIDYEDHGDTKVRLDCLSLRLEPFEIYQPIHVINID